MPGPKPMTTPTTQPATLPVSSDGSCGPTKRCPDGNCCSKFGRCQQRYQLPSFRRLSSSAGFCGNTPGHCGVGCQEKFGVCKITDAPSQIPVQGTATIGPKPVLDQTTKPNSSIPVAELPVSTDGSCGNGFRCPDGACCSRFGSCHRRGIRSAIRPLMGLLLGFCGTTNTHCITGCQPEFGVCKVLTTPPPSFCGAKFGNRSCSSGLCCGPNGRHHADRESPVRG